MAGTLHGGGVGWESQLQAQDAQPTNENCCISRQYVAKVDDRDWVPWHGSTQGERMYSILE